MSTDVEQKSKKWGTNVKRVKKKSVKTIADENIFSDSQWTVRYGKLKPGRGRPEQTQRLFLALGEKLPFESLSKVRAHLKEQNIPRMGVYIAHDSMSYARYIGRGNIFQRLASRKKAKELELKYFSFYVVKDKKHEREIESLLIRAAGPMLQFNTKKKRLSISSGNVKDYEPGTFFFERRYMRGMKRRKG